MFERKVIRNARADLSEFYMTVCQRNAMNFQEMWESGEALNDDTTAIIISAAKTIYAAQELKQYGGFFVKRTANKIKNQVEHAMTQANLLPEVAKHIRDIASGDHGEPSEYLCN